MPFHRTTILTALLFAVPLPAAEPAFAPDSATYKALAAISADSLRGHLSFLASDLLEGRGTPSRGLDIAAEYIAAQFRRVGLEPAGDDGYFQTATLTVVEQNLDGLEFSVDGAGRSLVAAKDKMAVVSARGVDVSRAGIFKLENADTGGLKREAIEGKVVALGTRRNLRAVMESLAALGAAAALDPISPRDEAPTHQLVDPEESSAEFRGLPRLVIRDADILDALSAAPQGDTQLTATIHLPAPAITPVKVRNVIGVLRGSDPVLRGQYVLLTAHYDHLGTRTDDTPDPIYNGANDDGSGTVSVIEVAEALATLPVHPKRSIVFLTFFGEEAGELGSRYYVRHPVFPLDETVADVNLEQLGRTDSSQGPQLSNASVTGFAYSSVTQTLQQAGELTGVKVYETANGDEYFNRSDNEAFADRGIPSHTVVVAFEFPDYHAVADEWPKIDYGNMAKVDRMIALGAFMLAEAPQQPKWNDTNPKVTRYRQAR